MKLATASLLTLALTSAAASPTQAASGSGAPSLEELEAAEVLTHLAFYSGWPNIFSTLPVARTSSSREPSE